MIKVNQLNKHFSEHIIFDNFNYKFVRGKSYALIGSSGSGKTTLLNMIGKLEQPDSGEVIVKGKNLYNIREKDYFQHYVSYLFQNYGLIENKSIEENLDLAFIGKKINKKIKKKKMQDALHKVNLNLELNRKVFSLSGGEAQRVAIAKTILKDSPIILADEPTASLDEKNSEEIVDIILQLQNRNRVIIIATHSTEIYKKLDEIVQIG